MADDVCEDALAEGKGACGPDERGHNGAVRVHCREADERPEGAPADNGGALERPCGCCSGGCRESVAANDTDVVEARGERGDDDLEVVVGRLEGSVVVEAVLAPDNEHVVFGDETLLVEVCGAVGWHERCDVVDELCRMICVVDCRLACATLPVETAEEPCVFGDLYGPPEGADKGEERCVSRLICVDLLLCLLPCALEHNADAHTGALRLHVELLECALECPAVLDGHQRGAPISRREAQLPRQHPSPEVLALLARQEASHVCVLRRLHCDVPAQEELVPLEVACLAARGHLYRPAQRPQAHPVQVIAQPPVPPPSRSARLLCSASDLCGTVHCGVAGGGVFAVAATAAFAALSCASGRAWSWESQTYLPVLSRTTTMVAMLSVRCVSAGTSMKVTIALSPIA